MPTPKCQIVPPSARTPISSLPYAQSFEDTSASLAEGWNVAVNSASPNCPSWLLANPATRVGALKRCADGDQCWYTGATSYNNDEWSSLVSPMFDFGALASDPFVTFYVYFDTEVMFDGLSLQMSIDGGS